MVHSAGQKDNSHGRVSALARELVARCIDQRRPRRILLLTAQPAEPVVVVNDGACVLVTVAVGGGNKTGSVDCRGIDLPFQAHVFDLVVAHQVLADGNEPELLELERVMGGGGQLLALGNGICGRTVRTENGAQAPPAVRPWRLCRNLRSRAFEIEECTGIGLGGKPVRTGEGWKKPLVLLSDQVLVRARRRNVRPIVTPLRFSQPRTAGAQSAVHENFHREAAC